MGVTGIGVDMVVNYPLAMFGTDPRLTHREGKIVLRKKSGKASIEYNLEKMGLRGVGEEKVAELLKQVKAKGTEKRGLLTDEEFKQLAERVLG
jgi:methanogen homocitrate synthase